MKEQKKQPELRFKGFTDDWEQVKLKDIATFSKGKGYTKEDLTSKGKEIILYGRLYVNYETVISNIDTFVDSDKNAVKSVVGDVIVPGSGETSKEIARAAVVNKTGIILGGDINIIRISEGILSSVFLALTLSNGAQQKELIKRAQGKSVVHLRNTDLMKILINTPILTEQQKIGGCFQKLNHIITLQQRRLELLKKLKQGYLQQMFPAKDMWIPLLRFNGFKGDWEQSKLGKQVSFINGRAYKQNELLDFGKYRVLRVGNFNTNDKWYYSNLELKPEKYANKGDLLYIWATDFGPKIWNEEKVIYHYHIWNLNILNKGLNKQYLFTWLQTDKERIEKSTNGTTMLHITKGNIEQRSFQYPQIHEQQKIGEFFKTIDFQLTLQQSKIERQQQLKRAYLQKLFP